MLIIISFVCFSSIFTYTGPSLEVMEKKIIICVNMTILKLRLTGKHMWKRGKLIHFAVNHLNSFKYNAKKYHKKWKKKHKYYKPNQITHWNFWKNVHWNKWTAYFLKTNRKWSSHLLIKDSMCYIKILFKKLQTELLWLSLALPSWRQAQSQFHGLLFPGRENSLWRKPLKYSEGVPFKFRDGPE